MSRPRTIVYLIEHLALGGGIETVVLALLRGVSPERYRILPWFLSGKGPSFERVAAEFPDTRFLNLQTYHRPGPLLRLGAALRKARPDAVHLHGYFCGTFGRLVAPWQGIPWIYSLYSHYEDIYNWRHYMAEYWLSKTRGLVVACSNVVGEFAARRCGVAPEKVVVNHEGVDVAPQAAWPTQKAARRLLRIPQEVLVIGTVTRFYPGKNVQLLIRASTALPADAHVLIAGNGPEEQALRKLAFDLAMEDRIHFVGLLQDVSLALAAMDVFIQMSRVREGFSMALVEAMGFGKPVIATAVGGNKEAVTEETGWLVPSDDVEAMQEAFQDAAASSVRLERMGQAARARYLANFTGRHMVQGMERVYDHLLQRS
jgi:glycosyltransferase involved in cell wall biosynthesis